MKSEFKRSPQSQLILELFTNYPFHDFTIYEVQKYTGIQALTSIRTLLGIMHNCKIIQKTGERRADGPHEYRCICWQLRRKR